MARGSMGRVKTSPVRLDEEVQERLKWFAGELQVPFSTPNNIMRILLGLSPMKGIAHRPDKALLEELTTLY